MACFPGPLVIVGSGLAAYALAREFRKLDTEQPVVLICADNGCQYSKPLLSTAIAQQKNADDLATASAADMADRLGLIIRNNTRVDAIDAEAHRLIIGNERFPYGKLVLAVGAEAVPLKLDGNAAAQAMTVNSLADYRQLRSHLEQVEAERPAIVIAGGGLVGCELASDFVSGDYDIDLVCSGEQLLDGLVPAEIATVLRQRLENAGVACHLSRRVESLHQHPQGLLAGLDNRQHLPAHALISAIGLRPATALARSAGLTLGQRGIAVDRYLQTSDPDIYALGDCAEVDGVSLLYVKPLMACARALAATLATAPVRVAYGPMPVTIKTPVMPLLVAAPSRLQPGSWSVDQNHDGFRAEFRHGDGHLLGYALTDKRITEQSELNPQLPEFF